MCPHHAQYRILAERLRAAADQMLHCGATRGLVQSETRPAIPDARIIEQALMQVITVRECFGVGSKYFFVVDDIDNIHHCCRKIAIFKTRLCSLIR